MKSKAANRIAEMHKAKQELIEATGLRVGCCLFPPKKMLGKKLCKEVPPMRRQMFMFSVHEPRGHYPWAQWLGAGDTVKEAKADFLENLQKEYDSNQSWQCKTYQTAGKQYLPVKA